MAWTKLIRSGSNAELSNLFASNAVTASFFSGNGANITGLISSSYALSASYAPSTPAISASYAATASYVSGTIINGGNIGAVIIGTNDAASLSFETNNVVRVAYTGASSTGGALTHTDVTANTSTVETNVTRVVNSSGTPAAGFGQRQLLQLETTTTNAQDAAAIDAVWTTATHASRTAAIVFSNVSNAAALSETFRIAGDGTLSTITRLSNTTTAANLLTLTAHSTGTPAAGFGGNILFQGESSISNYQDMASISAYWGTATHASRVARLGVYVSDFAGSTQAFYIHKDATIGSPTLVPGPNGFTMNGVGTFLQFLGPQYFGSSVTTSDIVLTTAASNFRLNPNSATSTGNSVYFGGTTATHTAGEKSTTQFDQGYTVSSGTGGLTSVRIVPTLNQTAAATGINRGIHISPTFTSLTGSFRGIDLNFNHANAKGIYQSGSSTTNNLVGKTMLGSTDAPAEILDVTGNVKITGQIATLKFSLTDAATVAIDWNNSNMQSVTLGGNRTFTFANPKSGSTYVLLIKQDATGTRTVTWPTVLWAGGVAPTLTVVANKTDIITIFYDGTSYYGSATLNY